MAEPIPPSDGKPASGRGPGDHALSVFNDSIPLLEPAEAWEKLKAADAQKETIFIGPALFAYAKSNPEATVPDMELLFRSEGLNTHLIGKEIDVPVHKTLVDLQGNIDRTYIVHLHFKTAPTRKIFASAWPTSTDQNLERLANAGWLVSRGMPKCYNCKGYGHFARICSQDPYVYEKPKIMCRNCNQEGHYLRDCPEPRGRRENRGDAVGGETHAPRDDFFFAPAGEPRAPPEYGGDAAAAGEGRAPAEYGGDAAAAGEGRTPAEYGGDAPAGGLRAPRTPFKCHNCGEAGHCQFDCPKPIARREPLKCFHCGEAGHVKRDCTNPKGPMDWSRVECRKCGEMGHGELRCPKVDSYVEPPLVNMGDAPDASFNQGFASFDQAFARMSVQESKGFKW